MSASSAETVIFKLTDVTVGPPEHTVAIFLAFDKVPREFGPSDVLFMAFTMLEIIHPIAFVMGTIVIQEVSLSVG
eukprot:CAMPEP_0116872016 /NCGR_PEP_ID=MMETSP0463-20121206/2630_1 /TAXON_ID=181622 /ORGANISM="Strombidinopsis sp, Strain SopsisLIS2011" /LENGTH=74 /DNA_ID=CAMNT_0004511543 /DNA_START=570 /DNA_END=790 /DNA_ORIENTATION=-